MDWTDWINRSCGCTVSAGIHPPDPFHLVAGVQRFRNALSICLFFYQPKEKLLRLSVNIRKTGVQFATCQVAVSNQFILQSCAFICDNFFHSYNLLFLSAIVVAGGIAGIECADSKKAPSRNHFQDGAFLLWIRANISRQSRLQKSRCSSEPCLVVANGKPFPAEEMA